MTESKKPSESDVALADRVNAAIVEFNAAMLACREARPQCEIDVDINGSTHRNPLIYDHKIFRTVVVTRQENIARKSFQTKD